LKSTVEAAAHTECTISSYPLELGVIGKKTSEYRVEKKEKNEKKIKGVSINSPNIK
jgi:hypothetical protein